MFSKRNLHDYKFNGFAFERSGPEDANVMIYKFAVDIKPSPIGPWFTMTSKGISSVEIPADTPIMRTTFNYLDTYSEEKLMQVMTFLRDKLEQFYYF